MADKKISALTAATTPLAGTEVLPIVQGGATVKVSAANITAGRDVSAKTLTGESNGVGGPTEIFARNTAGGERVQIISRNSAGISYIQTQNSQMLIGSYDNFAVQFMVNNSSKLLLDTNNDVKVQTGNLVVGTAGKGIDFSANTHAAGMTKEVLDWYEEGDFTPTVEGSSSAGTASYAARTAKYTRIGRAVYFEIYLIWSGGTGTGGLLVSGLPFISAANPPYGAVSAPVFFNIPLTASHYCSGAYVFSSDTRMRFFQNPVGGGAGSSVPYSASGEVMLAGYYFT